MVVIRKASIITRCIFSNKLIKPQNMTCLFNEEQYNAFEKNIYIILNRYLPYDLIESIIKATNYKKHIGRFGHENIAHWTIKPSYNYNNIRKLLINNYREKDDSEEDNSEEDDSEFDDLENQLTEWTYY